MFHINMLFQSILKYILCWDSFCAYILQEMLYFFDVSFNPTWDGQSVWHGTGIKTNSLTIVVQCYATFVLLHMKSAVFAATLHLRTSNYYKLKLLLDVEVETNPH